MGEIATKRIPITPKTQQELKDFKDGLGTDYDRAVQVLFYLALGDQQDKHIAGRQVRAGVLNIVDALSDPERDLLAEYEKQIGVAKQSIAGDRG